MADLLAYGEDIIGFPGGEATAKVKLMKLLWENPDTTVDFAGQSVQLASGDWDLVLIIAITYKGGSAKVSLICDGNGRLIGVDSNTSPLCARDVVKTDSTHLTFANAVTASQTSNFRLIPYQIYGIKLEQEIPVVAENVSTLAANCLLSDGETSVEDRLTANTLSGMTTITDYTNTNRYQCPSDGYIRINARVDTTIYVYVASTSISSGVLMLGVASAKEQNIMPCFVKKGTYVYCSDKSGNVDVIFESLL